MEVGRGDEQVRGPLVADRVADHPRRLGPERQSVLRLLGARLALGVVVRPLVERDDALQGLVDHLLPEFDRLGQHDLFLGRQQGDLADLLEVHADRVVDPDHVGAERLELFLGGLLELDRIELRRCIERDAAGCLAVLADDFDAEVGGLRQCVGGRQ